MIAMVVASYPGHVAKQVIQAFMSPDLPKRPASVKELSSISYADPNGFHGVFMFDVPDADVAEFVAVQNKRNVFIATRAPGLTTSMHLGPSVAEGIKNTMSLLA